MGGRTSQCTLALCSLCAACGCIPVRPEADYQRAAVLMQQRTGSPEVYIPKDDAAVGEKVEQLLTDGLTVDETVTLGLLNNRSFQATFYDIGISRAEVVQAVLLKNPTFSFAGLLPEGGGRADLQLSFAQELVDLWQIPVRKKVAEAQLESTLLGIARQAVELATQIRSKAYNVITLRQQRSTVEDNLRIVEQSEQLAQRRFEAGGTGALDVNLARSRTVAARVQLLQVIRELEIAETSLANTLNLSGPDRRIDLVGELPPLERVPDAASLFALALEQRLDARAADYSIKAAVGGVRQAWLGVLPSLTAGFQMERMEARALGGRKILADTVRESIAAGRLTAPAIQPASERRRERSMQVDAILGPSFAVTLPIWDQNQAQIAIAKFTLTQAYKRYEGLLNDIANQVIQATIRLNNALQIAVYYRDEGLPQATQALNMAEQIYQAGEADIVAVLQAQETLVSQRQTYVVALGEHARAVAELQRALGGPIPPPSVSTTQPVDTHAAEE